MEMRRGEDEYGCVSGGGVGRRKEVWEGGGGIVGREVKEGMGECVFLKEE